jgi:hypothetical protein
MLNHYLKVFQFLIRPYTLKIKILFFGFWIMSFFYILAFPSNFNLAFAGTANLSWTAPTTNDDGTALTDLTGFKVYYGTSSGNYGVPIDVGNQISYTVNGLGSGTYYFSVTAYNSSGNESTFASEGSKTVVAVPPVISGVSATNITPAGATIIWSTDILSNSQVEYGLNTSYGSLTTLDSSLVTSHSQALSGLLASTTYHFRVRSTDGAGNLTTSGDNTFTTSAIALPVISGIAASNVTTAGATISWTTDVASNSQVEYGTSTSYGSLTSLASSLVTSHIQAISGLQASTTYHFRVRSANGSGNLSLSGDNTFTTSSVVVSGPVISAISTGTIATDAAIIKWTTSVQATSQVEYGTTNSYGLQTPTISTLVTSHNQTLNGLQASTTYHYRVKSSDAAGNLSTSGDNVFTTASAPVNTGGPLSGPSSTNLSPQQTPAVGGCGMIIPKDEKSSSPGQAADLLAILLVGLIILIRKPLKSFHILRCLH